MNIKLPEQINRENWLRYLQVKGEPNERLARQMDEAEKLLLETAQPRGIYRVLNREDLATEGISIEKHLEGCDKVAIMAVTIGSGVDALIRRYELADIAMAMVIDTGASALAEQVGESATKEMTEELAGRNADIYFTPGFSPGYGDYPVTHQGQILEYVDAARKTGITLTPGNMMVPAKSITSIVGIADHPVTGRLATCEECVLRDKCDLWREGKHC